MTLTPFLIVSPYPNPPLNSSNSFKHKAMWKVQIIVFYIKQPKSAFCIFLHINVTVVNLLPTRSFPSAFLERLCLITEWNRNKGYSVGRRCASRDSTNQNALFVAWFSRLERAVFRVVYGEILALSQAWIGNFDTKPPWKVFETLYLDSGYVTFKYFAFLSVWDKFELLGHVQTATMIWVLFSPFLLDSLLVTVSGFIALFCPSC